MNIDVFYLLEASLRRYTHTQTPTSTTVLTSQLSTQSSPNLGQDEFVQDRTLELFHQAQRGSQSILGVGLLLSQPQRRLHQRLATGMGGFHDILDPIVDFFEQEGHRRERRRSHDRQFVRDVDKAATDGRTGPVRQGRPEIDRLSETVGPRQKGQGPIGFAEEIPGMAGHVAGPVDVAANIGVRQCDALGFAGRSGRIDETGQIVGSGRKDAGSSVVLLLDSKRV